MSEQKFTNQKECQVQIADDVIKVIAGTAALEVEGVAGMSGKMTGGLSEILGKKNLAKGVKISVDGNVVTVQLDMIVQYGFKIKEVAEEVQKRVVSAIETMTGLSVNEVNVHVSGIYIEKQKEIKEIPAE